MSVHDTPSSVEQFLTRLAAALEALGPAEVDEVVAEIRAHLAEATADAGGDETAALAAFGSSEALAARILEERGVVTAGSTVPEATFARRFGAAAVDGAVWLVKLQILLALASIPVYRYGSPSQALVVAFWVCAAVLAVGMVWRLIVLWRRPGYATTGMELLGVRRIRVGNTTRIVRERDVPGGARAGRVWPAIVTLVAVYLLVGAGVSVAQNTGHDAVSQSATAITGASHAASAVSTAYQQALAGVPVSDAPDNFAPGAVPAYAALLRRHAAGTLLGYTIDSIELDHVYDTGGLPKSGDLSLFVTVGEYAKRVDTSDQYRYHVTITWTPQGDGVSQGTTLIQSVEHVPQ